MRPYNSEKIKEIFFIALFLLPAGMIFGQAVPKNFANNPTSVQWLQTETLHFNIVFSKRYAENGVALGGLAEEIYQEYKTLLGTAPDKKITLYLNDEDEIISGIRALKTDEAESIWKENDYRQNISPDKQNVRDALAYEIGYVFQEDVEYFPIDYYFYLFSDPSKHPWADGLPAYLTVQQNTYLDTRWMRNYWYTRQTQAHKVYRSIESTNIILGRSQILYFSDLFSSDSLKTIYSNRKSLLGLVNYFDFKPAFKKASGLTYENFYERWKKYELEKYRREKSASNAINNGEAYAPLNEQTKVREYLGIKTQPSGADVATITLPSTGRLLQQLAVLKDKKTIKIDEGYFHPVMDWQPVKNELVYSKQVYDPKGNYHYELFLSDVMGKNKESLTNNKHAKLPSFSPTGNKLAYLSTIDGNSAVLLKDMNGGAEEAIYTFDMRTTVGRLFWHPKGQLLLISYRSGKGIYKAGILDIETHQFSAFDLMSNAPLNMQWGSKGEHVYFNGIKENVPNIFTAEISHKSLSNIQPVTSVFQGAELWDTVTDSASNEQVLAQNMGSYRRSLITAYPAKPLQKSNTLTTSGFNSANNLAARTSIPDNDISLSSSDFSMKPYHSFSNIRWETPFFLPYYLASDDFGLAGYASLKDPLHNHDFSFTGALSVSDPLNKSYFYSHYTNNSFRPQLKLFYNHFPAALGFFGTSKKVKTTDVIALSSLWKINALSKGYSNWYFGLLLRHQAYDYFSDETLRSNHPNIYFENKFTRQTDLRVALAWRVLKPYRHTLIHPLDGTGVRLAVTGSDAILGSQTQYARIDLSSYTILPGGGNNRFYLYGNGAFDISDPAGRDYLAFTDNGNYQLPDPDFVGSVNPGLGRYVRGYSSTVLGEKFLFGTVEYRIPFQLDSNKKLLGIIPPARMALAFFVDGGVLGEARTSANKKETIYRSSFGTELKRVFAIGSSFKFTYELGLAQPFDQALSFNPYFNVKAAIPF